MFNVRVSCIGDSNAPVTSMLSYNTLSGLLSATPTKSSSSSCDSYVVFVGCDLEEKKLKDILRECLPQVAWYTSHETIMIVVYYNQLQEVT